MQRTNPDDGRRVAPPPPLTVDCQGLSTEEVRDCLSQLGEIGQLGLIVDNAAHLTPLEGLVSLESLELELRGSDIPDIAILARLPAFNKLALTCDAESMAASLRIVPRLAKLSTLHELFLLNVQTPDLKFLEHLKKLKAFAFYEPNFPGYSGVYSNRLHPGWVGSVQPVPWIKKKRSAKP